MIFSFILSIFAIILLFIGIQKRSSYFLIPYLLMQVKNFYLYFYICLNFFFKLAILISTFALCVYITLLLIGGTSITIDTIFFEDSTRGQLGKYFKK